MADTFDAMTTKRLYQRTFLPDEALATILRRAGSYYDPLLVKAFINCMGVFPVGSTVALSTGELAVVVESSLDPELVPRPRVNLVSGDGKHLATPIPLDLALPDNAGVRILRCVDPESLGLPTGGYGS